MPTSEAAPQEGMASLVDELGLLLEDAGYQRMAGRTLAQLMLGGKRLQSQAEIARALNASIAAVSLAVRQLVAMGLASRVTVRGAQRDYYRLVPDGWRDLLNAQSKMRSL